MSKQDLIDLAIEQIKQDILDGDVSALEGLLNSISEAVLREFLPEN